MIIENLKTENLIEIANNYVEDNWKRVYPENKWNGFDLVGDHFIFQLSYKGTLRFFYTNGLDQVDLDQKMEDEIRRVLNEILSNK